MTISSINTNIAAMNAQQNIGTATSAVQNEVTALSSGNRIVNASTDVAALSTGTALQSQVNSLTTALSIASQGQSLLQVADGALSQIQSIIERQQAIAASAQSGSISDTQRGFLQQEFSNLSQQIDQLANSTNFNGVDLLNGAIQGGVSINTNTTNGNTATPVAAQIADIDGTGAAGNAVAGDTITLTVAGQPAVTFTFGTATGDVGVGATAADTAANLAAALNNSGSSELADFHFSSSGTAVNAYYTGTASSVTNIPSLTIGDSAGTTSALTTTASPSFTTATTIGTLTSGVIQAGDKLTVGSHTITFDAYNTTPTTGYSVDNSNGTITVDIGQASSTDGISGTALNNLVSALNVATGDSSFSDLSGVTFSTDSGTSPTHLYASYAGTGATSPTISTSYTPHTPTNFGGGNDASFAGASSVLTFDGASTGYAALTDGSSVFTIGGVNFSVVSGGSSYSLVDSTDVQIHDGGNLSATLTNLVSALNNSTVNGTDLAAALRGVTFSTNGTSVYANNPTATSITGITTTFTNALPASGNTINSPATALASAGTAATVATIGTNFSAGNTLTINGEAITFVATGETATGNEVVIGAANTDTLNNLVTFLNNAGTEGTMSTTGGTWAVASTDHLTYTTGSVQAQTVITTTEAAGSIPNATVATSASLNGSSVIGSFSGGGNIGAGDVITVGNQTNTTTSPTDGELIAGSIINIAGSHITFVSSGATGDEVNVGTNNFASLSNLATFLNGTTGQALLSSGSSTLTGATFYTDGTSLIAKNTTTAARTGSSSAVTNGADQPTGATVGTGGTATTLAAGATSDVLTMGIDTIVIGASGSTTAPTTAPGSTTSIPSATIALASTSQTLSTTLAAIASYLNSTGVAGDTVTFNSNATQLLGSGNQGTASTSATALTTTYSSSTTPVFGGVTGEAIAATSIVGLGAGVTSAVGTPSGNLFVSSTGTTASNFGQAVDLSKIANNADFVGAFGGTGTIGAITANYVNTGTETTSGVQLSVVVGNDTYTTSTITNAQLDGTAPVSITFTGSNTTTSAAEGGSFTLTLQPQADITSQNDANQLATGINSALSTVSAYQNRNVLSYNNNYSAEVSNVVTGTLQGSSLTLNSGDFSNPIISSVSVSAPSTGETAAQIQIVLNGQTYSTISGVGDKFNTDSTITLENLSNPSQTLTLTTGNVGVNGTAGSGQTAIDLSSASNAAAFQTALSNALGLSNASAALSFQVGSSTSDSIGVSIGSATTSSLFGGQTLDVSTITDASNASNVLSTALNTVTALRASVGALEERFNFATSAATSASQNETAAESNLLNTDVASESTTFATSQVELQAGIAVLAQANQLDQSLLKLLQ